MHRFKPSQTIKSSSFICRNRNLVKCRRLVRRTCWKEEDKKNKDSYNTGQIVHDYDVFTNEALVTTVLSTVTYYEPRTLYKMLSGHIIGDEKVSSNPNSSFSSSSQSATDSISDEEIKSKCLEALGKDIICMPIYYDIKTQGIITDGYPGQKGFQAYLWPCQNRIYLSFRGSEEVHDFIANMDVRMLPFVPEKPAAKVHNGFYKQFQVIEKQMTCDIQFLQRHHNIEKVITCGHSLGGSIAVMSAAYLTKTRIVDKIECYTIGCPRIGNSEFASYISSLVTQCHRIYTPNDVVTYLPPLRHYAHCGKELGLFDPNGDDDAHYLNDTTTFNQIMGVLHYLILKPKPFADHVCGLYIKRLYSHITNQQHSDIVSEQ